MLSHLRTRVTAYSLQRADVRKHRFAQFSCLSYANQSVTKQNEIIVISHPHAYNLHFGFYEICYAILRTLVAYDGAVSQCGPPRGTFGIPKKNLVISPLS